MIDRLCITTVSGLVGALPSAVVASADTRMTATKMTMRGLVAESLKVSVIAFEIWRQSGIAWLPEHLNILKTRS